MSDTHSRTRPARNRPTPDSSEIETMHDVFSDWERRAILYYLQENDGRATVEEVAAHLVGWWDGDDSPAAANDGAVARVRNRLGCAHLLKLDDFGVVAYDARRETVRLAEEMKISISEPWSDRPDERRAPTRLVGEETRR
ncbi:hypothetical protein [Halosimplex sp. TS25]|uniref:DUF7344 domain-containing protein n=1 Tax=Halosimplex rarum TaxID=3396619 RepID=UPI0039E8B22B